ncbi:MAG: heme o synthase [Dehalococcoidia bacterium]
MGLNYRAWTTVAAYISLLKLRTVALNILSALTGVFLAVLAVGSGIPWNTASILIISGGLVAAGSGAINSYLDRDIDEVMQRTSRRPLPSGRIKPAKKALYIGIFLVILGLIIAVVGLNLMTTLFIALGATIYIFIYTMWLKRKTPWSVVVGGLAGSCALLAGWSSVTTSFGLPALLFSIFVLLWTPGHFWGLAIRNKDDSERASIPTLPTIYGERIAAKWAASSSMALVPFSIIPYALGILGEAYLIISLSVGLIVLIPNIRLYFAPTAQKAWTVFKLSSPYLAIVYLAVAIDILLA